MIKKIQLKNFYSFQEEHVMLDPDVNILVGINGAGKSNFLKAIKLLVEGISGNGLYNYIIKNLGSFEDIFFKGPVDTGQRREIFMRYVFDGKQITEQFYGASFRDDIAYDIRIINVPGSQNYFIEEHVFTIKSDKDEFHYLDFKNGIGYLSESRDGGRKLDRVRYEDGDPRELRGCNSKLRFFSAVICFFAPSNNQPTNQPLS